MAHNVDSTPVGEHSFVDGFMKDHCEDFQRRLRVLQALVQHLGPTLFMRLSACCALACFRTSTSRETVPWPVLQPWAARLDTMILDYLEEVPDLPAWTPQALAALRAPLDRYAAMVLALSP